MSPIFWDVALLHWMINFRRFGTKSWSRLQTSKRPQMC